jgi:OHCU decarboxylase
VTLDDLNGAPERQVRPALHACCASSRWIAGILNRRPFASFADLSSASDALCAELEPNDIREAIAAHPRIGAGSAAPSDSRSRSWSAGEQSGVSRAAPAVRAVLLEANRQYEARFGHIFLVNATGKSADDVLACLHARLRNTPDVELACAGEELRQITRLRLAKLVAATEGSQR